MRAIKEVFPMDPKEREAYLESMTPDARAWFYMREQKALEELGLLWPKNENTNER